MGRRRIRGHRVLRRRHLRTGERRRSARRQHHRMGPRRAAAGAARGQRRHGVTMVLAHEYGHADPAPGRADRQGHPDAGRPSSRPTASPGAYMRWVAEGNSPRFTLSTGDGLNNLLAAMIAFRDPLLNEDDPEVGVDEHGSAFERVSAFQFGFTDGAAACAAIDMKEIGQRRGDLPGDCCTEDQTGELAITEESVQAIVDAMDILFSPANPPKLSFDARRQTTAPTPGPARRRRSARRPTRSPSTCPSCEAMGTPVGHARTASAWRPATTPRTRCWSRGTCWRSSTSTAAWCSTTPKPRCARRA